MISEAGLVVAEGEGDELKVAVVPSEESADVAANEVTSVPGTARAVSTTTPECDHPKCMLITDPPLVEHPSTRPAVDITMKSFATPSENESFINRLPFAFATTEPKR